MLRRIADSFFWAARYLERAEWRARLVDVNYRLLIESPVATPDPWMALLAIVGDDELFEERGLPADDAAVLDFFTFDTKNPSSIRSCIYAARENARALRHRISSELWLELNTLFLDAHQWSLPALDGSDLFGFFSDLRDRFYKLSGIIYGTLPRDLEFDFLSVGTFLERTDSVSRLLDVKYHVLLPRVEDVGGPIDLVQWAALLRSASALEAYRKAHGNSIQVDRVVELLLFDPTFPRSARFCVDRLESSLRRIAEPGREASPLERLCARDGLAARLRERTAGQVIEAGLHDFVLECQDECEAIGAAVFDEYLRFE